jgi:molecular chaperone GrpE (heat shock protein)
MLDFRAELEKLLAMEEEPLPENEAAGILKVFNQRQIDIAMQAEEIYDIVKDADNSELTEALRNERKRSAGMAQAVMGLCDIIEDFHAYAAQNGGEALARQALMMWRNTARLLEGCGMCRISEPGESGFPFDTAIHKAQSAAPSSYPRETVVRVLRSGYRQNGEVIRKAAVVVSSGGA